ncbi:MAG TPA: cell division protein SepF [Firmicutes bacterium]|nr:cell division protein SepF [Bacillota bacterium]
MGKWENEDNPEQNMESKKGVFEKFLNIFGFEAEEIMEEEEGSQDGYHKDPRDRGKLVNLNHSNKTVKLIVVEPEGFEEVQAIVDHLKNKRAVILNLEETEKVTARRIADFLGGAIYALDGTMQRVSGSIFLFTPAHIEVTMPLRTELREKEKERSSISPSNPNLTSSLFRNERER